jgi:hypothetical protein
VGSEADRAVDRVSDRAVELAVVAELVAAEVPVAAGAGPAAAAGQVVDR